MDFNIHVKGMKELEDKLIKLGAEVGHKELKRGLMAASLPTVQRAKALTKPSFKDAIQRRSHRTGKLKVNKIGQAAGGNQAAGVSIIVNRKSAPYAHMFEAGTVERYTKGKNKHSTPGGAKSGQGKIKGRKVKNPGGKGKKGYRGAYRGKVEKEPFFMVAWESEGGTKAVDAFKKKLSNRIKKLTK